MRLTLSNLSLAILKLSHSRYTVSCTFNFLEWPNLGEPKPTGEINWLKIFWPKKQEFHRLDPNFWVIASTPVQFSGT